MDALDDKPSQAEGERLDEPERGFVIPSVGHPPQAEDEDSEAEERNAARRHAH